MESSKESQEFIENVENNPRYVSHLQCNMRALEVTGELALKQLECILDDMRENALSEKSPGVQERFCEILVQLQAEKLGKEISWIYEAEAALAKDSKVDRWLQCQDYGVEPIHDPENLVVEEPIRVECVYNALAEYEATLDKGRFLLNHVRYNKTKKQLESTMNRKYIH